MGILLLSSLNIHSLSPPYQNPLGTGVNSGATSLLVLLICHSCVTLVSLRCNSGVGAGVTLVLVLVLLRCLVSLHCHSFVTLVLVSLKYHSGVTPVLVLGSLQCLVSLLWHSGAGPGVTLVHSGIWCHFIVGFSVLPVYHHQVLLKIIEICYKLSIV